MHHWSSTHWNTSSGLEDLRRNGPNVMPTRLDQEKERGVDASLNARGGDEDARESSGEPQPLKMTPINQASGRLARSWLPVLPSRIVQPTRVVPPPARFDVNKRQLMTPAAIFHRSTSPPTSSSVGGGFVTV